MSKKSEARVFAPNEHMLHLAEFIKYVQAAGGTTPHLVMVVKASEGLPLEDMIWRGGCYAAVYNYAAAEWLWRNTDPKTIRAAGVDYTEQWLRKFWDRVPLRRERKAVNNPRKLAECLDSFATWMRDFPDKPWARPSAPAMRIGEYDAYCAKLYEQAWEDFNQVKYMGRYIAIRFLEYCRRIGATPAFMPDIRARGGQYPRQALALLYPRFEQWLNGNDSAENLEVSETMARCCRETLKHYGVRVDFYTLQSLLCEYKQSVLGQKQYPGRSIDSELGYFFKVNPPGMANPGYSQFYQVRQAAFPDWTLGEKHGWTGAREEPSRVLALYGYTWTDGLFDYHKTLASGDWSRPVCRYITDEDSEIFKVQPLEVGV